LDNLSPETTPPAPETGKPDGSVGAFASMLGGGFVRDLIETLLLAALLYVIINAVTARVRVDGFSMRPTLEDGEFVLVNRLSYLFGEPERGDIVVFAYPLNPDEDLIKRVIGLPGDQIRIFDGQVWINGEQLDEPYINAAPGYGGMWDVPEDALFVLGDNRNDSSDSHSWGFLPMDSLIGKAVIIYWPPPQWSVLDHADAAAAAPWEQ